MLFFVSGLEPFLSSLSPFPLPFYVPSSFHLYQILSTSTSRVYLNLPIPYQFCLCHPRLSHHLWLALIIRKVSLLVCLLSNSASYSLLHTVASVSFRLSVRSCFSPSQNLLVAPHYTPTYKSKIPSWCCHLPPSPSRRFSLLSTRYTWCVPLPEHSKNSMSEMLSPFTLAYFFPYVHITQKSSLWSAL